MYSLKYGSITNEMEFINRKIEIIIRNKNRGWL
jgi:hypothetical protein